MADISKISPDDGSTILNIKDGNAVHWGDQSKGYVGKNKIKSLPNENTDTKGVTFTLNSDGSITANGKATGGEAIYAFTFDLPSGSYIMSGVTGGSGSTFFIDTYNTKWTDRVYTLDGDVNVNYGGNVGHVFRIVIVSGYTANNLTFYPMIRLASIPDSTYEPWCMSNRELTEKTGNGFLPLGSGIYSADLNDAPIGTVYAADNATNNPTNKYGIAFTYKISAATSFQCFIDNQSNLCIRFKQNTWNAWYKFTGTQI